MTELLTFRVASAGFSTRSGAVDSQAEVPHGVPRGVEEPSLGKRCCGEQKRHRSNGMKASQPTNPGAMLARSGWDWRKCRRRLGFC